MLGLGFFEDEQCINDGGGVGVRCLFVRNRCTFVRHAFRGARL